LRGLWTDRRNTRWLARLVRRDGWPGISVAGADGAHAAWLLAQHADRLDERRAAVGLQPMAEYDADMRRRAG
jgi:hypothetical protein